MATYSPRSTSQKDVMPAIYIRDLGHAPYAESSIPGNMVYPNYSSSGVYSDTLPGSSQMHHNPAEIPVHTSMLSQESATGGPDLAASRIGDNYFNAWRDARNEIMQPVNGPQTNADDIVLSSVTDDPRVGLRTELCILGGGLNFSQQPSSVFGIQAQGLSLSLGTKTPMPSLQHQPVHSDTSFVYSHQSPTQNSLYTRDREIHVESSPTGLSKLACPIKNSKYLKAAQQLLDEVVNVKKALKQKTDKSQTSCGATKVNNGESESDEGHQNVQESTANSAPELSSTERQDLQNRMTKLLAMLDEVDRRYKHYYHQMQIVVSSFDVIAGCGAAKPYTALALQTISRHFRCLRDAIDSQIRATGKSLGEENPSSGNGGGISRLRYIDQQIRQQRAFQQFGMMPQHAWRPQRGLPETSVSILRAWLFEHFLHPYPKDSDKLMLARQTGLTRSQVSNWFINARVRLWKPMIEDMYKDEFGDTEVDCNEESAPKEEIRSSTDTDDSPNLESVSERRHSSQLSDSSNSGLIHNVQMDAAVTGFQREVNTVHMDLRLGEHRHCTEDGSLLQDVLVRPDESSRYMAYQMAEMGKYGNGGVSLTLGLQHCHGGLPGAEGHQSFVSVRGEDMYNPAPFNADMADYDCLNLVDRQHRFSSSQLLHDFVA